MSKKDDALRLAQDLRALADRFSEGWNDGIKIDASDIVLLSDAAEALAEQPAQTDWEAVAADQAMTIALLKAEQPPCKYPHCPYPCPDLPDCRDAEKPAQHQEPVAYASDVEFDNETEIIPAEQKGKLGTAGLRIPLYIKPPASKPWVGLTDEQLESIWAEFGLAMQPTRKAIARAIEAKLREKNA